MNQAIVDAIDNYGWAVRALGAMENLTIDHSYLGKTKSEWYSESDATYEKLKEAIEDYKNNNNPVTNLEARIVTLENSIKQLFDSKRFEVCQTLFGVPAEKGLTQSDLFQDVFLGKANTPPVGVGFAK